MGADYKPASCGVHETVGGRPCGHCPRVLAQLRLDAMLKVQKRVYTRPVTQTPGATPPNLRAKGRRAY